MPWHMVERESARLEAEALGWEKNAADATTRLAQQAGKLHRLEAIEVYCRRWERNIESFDWQAKRDALEGLETRVTGNGRDPEQWELQLLVDLSDVADTSRASRRMRRAMPSARASTILGPAGPCLQAGG